jgi:hypothetical protein
VRGGTVIYVGLTRDLYRREIEHRRNRDYRGAEFRVLERTNVYARQRYIEQRAIETYGRNQPNGRPLYNINQGISPGNPLYNFYNSLGD